MNLKAIWKTVLGIAALFLVGAAIWFFKDYQFQKSEAKRQTENVRQLYLRDSLNFITQTLSRQEIVDYLKNQNRELKANLENSNINLKRIERIVSSSFSFRDTTRQSTDLGEVLKGVRENRPISKVWSDSVGCMKIIGEVSFANDSLKVTVLDRNFANKSDAVVFWERKQWQFLFIKSRIFGKKQFSSKSFDECGKTITVDIRKKE